MAQKLAIALFALFGFANAQISLAHGGTVTILTGPPPQRYGGLTSHHDDDDYHKDEHDSGPRLGTKVVLGRAVVLGETKSEDGRHGQDDHDDEHH